MSEREIRGTKHDTFTIERTYPASRERVFRAWADPEAKARWFSGTPGKWKLLVRESDFRVGGRERVHGAWTDGWVSKFDCVYQEIVPNERIIYTYDMQIDDRRISISLATVELHAAGTGTRMVVTEQGVFLDGYDDAGSRERGTGQLMDRLGETLT